MKFLKKNTSVKYLIVVLFLWINFSKAEASSVLASTFGYNSTNATSAFQSAIQSANDTIIIDLQNSDWNVGPSSFYNLNNKTIIFQSGVILKAIPGLYNSINACLLQFNSCSNIIIIGYGARLKMNKAEYVLLNNSEYRMSIRLDGCNHIHIKGLMIDESGGDGIYVGGDQLNYCQNIFIEDVQCMNHYRQGLTVTNVQNMTVKNSYFAHTKGTLPEAGIDIEPYQPGQRIINLNIQNCRFENNGWAGIAVALEYLDSTSIPISIKVTDCVLKNNSSPSNTYALCEIYVSAHDSIPVQGNVLFERCFIEESQYGAYYSRKTAKAFNVKFKDCVFQNVSQLQIPYNEPIFLEVPSYSTPSGYLGGYDFDNVFISYSTNFSFFRVYGAATLAGIKDMIGSFTVVEPNNNPVLYTNVPDTINCNYTFSNQANLPPTSVNIKVLNNQTFECNQQAAVYQFERMSSRVNYPLGVSYSSSGTTKVGNDVHLLTKGAVIPTNKLSFLDSIVARQDSLAEPNESLTFTLQNSSNYTIGSNNIGAFTILDCFPSNIISNDVNNFKIYPNPASNFIYIENANDEILEISLFNVAGEKLISETISKIGRIEIKNLPRGFYFINIKDQNSNHSITKKIIKE